VITDSRAAGHHWSIGQTVTGREVLSPSAEGFSDVDFRKSATPIRGGHERRQQRDSADHRLTRADVRGSRGRPEGDEEIVLHGKIRNPNTSAKPDEPMRAFGFFQISDFRFRISHLRPRLSAHRKSNTTTPPATIVTLRLHVPGLPIAGAPTISVVPEMPRTPMPPLSASQLGELR